MPLTVKDGALLGAGMWCVAAATVFYKQKKTLPFKVAYFLSWPVLGSAIILTMMPSDERMKKELEQSGFSEQQIEEQRQRVAAQMQQLKHAAEEGKNDRSWPAK